MITVSPKEPKVRVILAVYNGADYVTEAIESVLTQTYQNIELIVVDDCSTDETPRLLKKLAARDHRIKIHSTSLNSGGPAKPRNIGIDKSSGDVIAFIDSDDIWHSSKLAYLHKLMTSNTADLVCCEAKNIEGDRWSSEAPNFLKSHPTHTRAYDEISHHDLIKKNRITLSSVHIKRSSLDKLRFSIDPDYVAIEDYDLWLRLLGKPKFKALKTPLKLVAYRNLHFSLSSSKIMMAKKVWRLLGAHQELKNFSIARRVYYFLYYVFSYIHNRVTSLERTC